MARAALPELVASLPEVADEEKLLRDTDDPARVSAKEGSDSLQVMFAEEKLLHVAAKVARAALREDRAALKVVRAGAAEDTSVPFLTAKSAARRAAA